LDFYIPCQRKLHLFQLENTQRDSKIKNKQCCLIPQIISFLFWLMIAWMEGKLLLIVVCWSQEAIKSQIWLIPMSQSAIRRSFWDKRLRSTRKLSWDRGSMICFVYCRWGLWNRVSPSCVLGSIRNLFAKRDVQIMFCGVWIYNVKVMDF